MSDSAKKSNGDIAREAELRIHGGENAYKVILDALDEYEENRRIRIVSEAARFGDQFECGDQA